MKPKIYVESSVISYLTARPTRDLVAAARQQLTREWWDSVRGRFDLYISALVLIETARGDPLAAKERLKIVKDIASLEIMDTALELANYLILKSG